MFNLARYKAAQSAAPSGPAMNMPAPEATQGFDFDSLNQALESDPFQTMQQLSGMIPADYTISWSDGSPQSQPTSGPAGDILKPDTWTTMTDPREKQQFLLAVLNGLPDAARGNEMNSNSDTVNGVEEQATVPASIQASVVESNAAIKKLAEAFVVQHSMNNKYASTKAYNHYKAAQVNAANGNYYFGPDTLTQLPSVQTVGNLWTIIERNKAWGLRPSEFPNIDYEQVWRDNIMDRFYEPQMDKDGNWVGGYLDKRFEIDKNIPELNNMQLRPGQKRKPILPEYGNIGSRMEAKHEADGKGKTFNWTKANSNDSVKTAAVPQDYQTSDDFRRALNRRPTPMPGNDGSHAAPASSPMSTPQPTTPSGPTTGPLQQRIDGYVAQWKAKQIDAAKLNGMVSELMRDNRQIAEKIRQYYNAAITKANQPPKMAGIQEEAHVNAIADIATGKKDESNANGVALQQRVAPKPFNLASSKKKVAYKETQPRGQNGMGGGKPASGVWNCPGCGSLRGAHETHCGGCGMAKGKAPTSFAIQPGGTKPGQRPRWNQPNNGPMHITPGQQMRHASVLPQRDDKKDDDALSQVLEHHKKRQRSFDALCGGPEEEAPVMVQPIRR